MTTLIKVIQKEAQIFQQHTDSLLPSLPFNITVSDCQDKFVASFQNIITRVQHSNAPPPKSWLGWALAEEYPRKKQIRVGWLVPAAAVAAATKRQRKGRGIYWLPGTSKLNKLSSLVAPDLLRNVLSSISIYLSAPDKRERGATSAADCKI